MNWYNRIKLADASAGVPVGMGDDFHPYEGGRRHREMMNLMDKKRGRPELGNDEIINMRREKGQSKPLRGKGRAFEKDRELDQTFINDVVRVPFERGDKVRDRRRGLAEKQQYGEVKDLSGNSLVIKWEGSDEPVKIPLNKPEFIEGTIEKV